MIEPVREKLGLPSLNLADLQAQAAQWAGSALSFPRDLERHMGFGQGALRPHDPLGDGRLRDQERPADLFRGQSSQ